MERDLLFEAYDVNDPNWEIIIKTLKENLKDFKVLYGSGDWMTFQWTEKEGEKHE